MGNYGKPLCGHGAHPILDYVYEPVVALRALDHLVTFGAVTCMDENPCLEPLQSSLRPLSLTLVDFSGSSQARAYVRASGASHQF
jgi:hypothetical protein